MTDDGADREDALYAAPPEGFVAARDALAKQLRADGDRAGAARVRALRRPTRAAWAINAAVRADPGAARALADAAGQLGDAQRELLVGGAPARLRDAQTRLDGVSETLLAAAPIDDAPTREKVRQTLRAAAVDADVLADVLSGRLLRERVASGFGGFGDLGDALPPPAREPAPQATAPAGPSAKAAERAAREAEREAERQAAARAAEAVAARAAAERLERARAEEAAAEQAAGVARGALAEAEAVVARRRAERDAAETRLADAVRERERAEQS